KIGVPGEYTVKLSDIAALNNTQVTLVDKVTGDKVDMLTQNEYQFTSYAKGTFDRFKVILSQKAPDISTALYVDKTGIRVLRDNGKVAFEGLNSLAEINEFDLSGRKLKSYTNINNGEYIALKSKSLSVLQIITHDQNIKIKITNK
nr:hypothetical protein [Paludibacter sp.]